MTARSQACSVLLQDGRVLVAGGNTANGVANTVEVFSQNGSFLTAAPMLTPRADASCSVLADGKVFVTGGTDGAKTLASSELYDPDANVWTPAGSMGGARSGLTATVLPWGPVLLIGGTDADGNGVRTVEQYLPITNTVAYIGNISTARKNFGVAVTPDQHVLIIGGTDGGKVLSSIDVFDAPANLIKAGGALLTGRRNFGAATLLDGTVLITGGYDAEGKVLGTSEIYDPVRGSTVAGPKLSGPRADHTAYTLPNNGSVLLVGGSDESGLLSTSDVYSFQAGKFSVGGTVRTARTGASQSLMKLGAMVMAGGKSGSTLLASSELYTFSTIKTGKLDYHPGEVADMTGTGFVPGEQVAIVVTAFPLDQHNMEFTGTATADATGKISLGGFNIDTSHEGMKFLVTATGSQSVAQQVFTDASDATTTTVTSSVNNVAYGTAVHFTATVTDTTNGAHTPDGNVEVTVDGASRGFFPLTPGAPSTVSTSDFTDIMPGTHVINAFYQGSATLPGFAASNSTTTPGSYTVNQVTTTTAVQTTQTPITRDQSVTFTANVTGNGGAYTGPFAGTVAFTSSVDGSLGSATVNTLGAATLTKAANTLSVNTHTITATFTPLASPPNSFTSSFNTLTQVVNAAVQSPVNTTTTITPMLTSPQDYGTAVNFTVSVTSSSGTPTGTVTITDTTTGTVLGSNLAVNGSGTATLGSPISTLTAVAHSIKADFTSSAPTTWNNSTGTTGFTVNPIAPTFGIVASPVSPAVAFQSLTFTLTATAVNGAVPTGNVSLTDLGGNVVATVPLSNGAATVQVPAGLAPNAYTFGWKYNNSADPVFSKGGNFPGSSNPSVLPYTINKGTTQTVTSASPTNPAFGQGTTFTTTISAVAPSTSGAAFGGTVTFYTAPAVIYLVNGVAQQNIPVVLAGTSYQASTASNSALPVGPTSVFAVYSGDTNFNVSTAHTSGTATVSTVSTNTVVTSNPAAPATVAIGANVTYTATVTAAQTNAINPGGTVTFYDNAVPIGTCTGVSVSVTGTNVVTATCPQTYASGSTGPHPISATYSGNTNFATSTSNTITTTVNGAATTTTLNLPAAGGTPTFGSTVNLQATVTSGGGTPTGTVNFLDGVQNIGSGTLNGSGVATATIATLAPGPHSISAQYAGATNFATSTSGTNGITVQQATPTFTISGFPAAAISYGSSNSFSVTVNGAGGGAATPTGTVTLNNGASQLGGAVTLASGVATLSIPNNLSPVNSPYTLTVKYQGDTNYSAQTSAGQSLTVNKADTTNSLVSSVNPASLGQTVTFTFTSTSTTSGTPTGNVNFKSDGNSIGVTGLVAGVATLSTSTLAAGSHAITADYPGDTTFNSALGVALTGNGGNETVNAAATTVSVQASTNSPSIGQQVTYTVTVTAPASTPAPVPSAGGITISDQGPSGPPTVTACGSVTPAGNVTTATCTATYASAGSHTVTASFNSSNTGQWNNATSSGITVSVGLTTTSISAVTSTATNSYTYGTPTDLRATVTPSTNTINPLFGNNTVKFLDGATVLGTATPDGTGLAVLPAVLLAGGSHSVTAQFTGDSSYSASPVSGTLTITVNKKDPAPTFTGTQVSEPIFGTVQYGSAIFGGASKVQFTQACPTCAFPTGSVVATIGNTTVGTYQIDGTGKATLTSTLLPASVFVTGNAQQVVFTYAGDSNYLNDPTGGQVIIVAVSSANENFTLSSSASPVNPGTNVTFTFTVAANPAIPGSSPGGSVTIKDGANSIGTVTVVNGTASLTTSTLTPGSHTISVAIGGYTGDINFSSNATPLSLTQVINPESTTTVIVPSTSTPTVGQMVTYTVTVSGTPVTPVGTAQVTDNGNSICAPVTITLTSGQGTCTIQYTGIGNFGLGNHQMVATFTPTDNTQFNASTSIAKSVTVGGTPTSTTGLTSSAGNSYTYGAITSLSATVSAQGLTFPLNSPIAGTVVFLDNGATLCGGGGQAACPVPNNANGLATLGNVALGGGTHTITAVFQGDSNYSSSNSSVPASQSVTMQKATPTLSVGGAPFTVTFGGGLTTGAITAAGVAQVGSSFAAPTGAVTAASGATAIGSAVIGAPASTTANYTFGIPTPVAVPTSIGVGAGLNLTFTIAADANYNSATFNTTITIGKAATNVTVSSATIASLPLGTNALYGQPIQLTALFSTVGGAGLTNGDTVAFTDAGGAITGCGSQTVTANAATCTLPTSIGGTPNFAVGGHSIGIQGLSTDPTYTLGTVTPLAFNVVKANSSVLLSNLTTPTNNSQPGQSVTFQATAAVTLPGGESPLNTAQTVTFFNAASPISPACTGVVVNAAGVAACSTAFATAGSYNITAQFSGDANVNGSTSALLVQNVGKPGPTVTVSSNANPSNYGAPVTFTATVVGVNGVTPTGNVQFQDGSTVLSVVNLAGAAGTATAQLTVSAPPLGNGVHSITATYNGDGNYSTSVNAPAFAQTVQGSTTNISGVTVSASPAVWGQPVTLSVTVTPAVLPSNGIPTGTVTFFDGATAIGGSPVAIPSGSETATLTGVLLSVGSHTAITAKYNGDANFGAVTSGSATLVVNKAATTSTISNINPAAVTYGQNGIVITAAVTVNTPGAGAPSGTVTFYDGGSTGPVLGTGSVVAGTASLTIAATSPLANPVIGAHNIVAVYGGDTNFQASTSAASQLTVGKAGSTTTIISSTGVSPSQSVVGQTVTFTATVVGTGVGVAPTGTMTFSSNGTPIGSAPISVNGGVASAVLAVPSNGVTPLPVGTNIISATYSGDGNYNVSNSPITAPNALQQVVSKAPTSIVLTSSTNSSVVGQQVTLTAILTVNPPGSGTPTGTVNFYNTVASTPVLLGTAQLVPAAGQNAANQFTASLLPQALPQGNLQLTAVYSGDNNYVTSTSTTVTQAVSKPAVTITLTNNINPSLYGQQVTFTATVTPLPPGTGTPTGQVTFFDGANNLAVVTLVGGQATYTGMLPVGNHSIAVSYPGDTNFQPFVSPTIAEIVNKIPSSISLITSAPSAVASQVLTFTAQISPVPPAGVAYPSGQVAFFDGSNQIGVGQLSSGVATFSTATLGTGLRYISAVYGGDGNWTGTTSAFVPQTVNLAQTTTQVVSSANPSVWGQPVTFTVTTGVAYPGTVPAQGLVQLYDNTAALGEAVNIANGTTQITIPSLAPGTHNIVAQYIGNVSFATSNSAAVTQTVNKAPTVTTLAALPGSSTSNQQVTLTAVVSVPTPGAGAPTGTVQFVDSTSNNVLGTAPLTMIGGVYTATLTTSQLSQAGAPRLLTATYSGDNYFATSTSPAQPQSVFGTEIAVTNAAGYSSTNFSPDGAVAIFVDNLVNTTLTAQTLPLPTSLAGLTVTVTDSAGVQLQAPLYFVSPSQINFLMPTSTAVGLATITVTNSGGATASGIVLVTKTAPGIFTANQNGQGIAQAVLLDVAPSGNQTRSNTAAYNAVSSSWIANAISMNTTDSYYLELYGTGIRYATGQQVTATINGQSVPVLYAGAQPQYPGLDQVDVQIPASLKGAGTVNIVLTVNGQAANTVTVTIQ
ncbi:MAG TPA: Ig-like domain repeat protein [Candidatus Limnocylindrales bacterium]|nr:Ig-like domain repeat protein [Candidatus Limnocylindrales bacterium]